MAKDSYTEYLKNQLGELIDQLNISGLQKQFIKNRWLDQMMWLEKKAGESQRKHLRLRMITIIGGVIIPAMVSLNIDDSNKAVKNTVFWGTFALAQIVAISAAVEEFFHYGERWGQYRRTAEYLKTEGWQYFQLSGPYAKSASHASAYRAFANRVERLIQEDVNAVSEDITEKSKQDDDGADDAKEAMQVSVERRNRRVEKEAAERAEARAAAERAAAERAAALPLVDIPEPPFGRSAPIMSEPPIASAPPQLELDPAGFDDEEEELPDDFRPPGAPILARDEA
jgi:Protein of unknown function (DUF4231)